MLNTVSSAPFGARFFNLFSFHIPFLFLPGTEMVIIISSNVAPALQCLRALEQQSALFMYSALDNKINKSYKASLKDHLVSV